MDYTYIINWGKENNAAVQTIENCRMAINNLLKDFPEYFDNDFPCFDKEKIVVSLGGLGLSVHNWRDAPSAAFVSCAHLSYLDKPLGSYRLIFDLSGEVVDDVLVTGDEIAKVKLSSAYTKTLRR